MWNLLRQATRWLLNLPGSDLDIQEMVDLLAPGMKILKRSAQKTLSADDLVSLNDQTTRYVDGNFPRMLATRTAMLDYVFPALDVVEIAARRGADVELVAKVFSGLSDALNLRWLMRQVESLEVLGQWHAQARANLRDELFIQHNHLVERILQTTGSDPDPVTVWIDANTTHVQRPMDMMHEMRNSSGMDYATIAVAVRSLARLVNKTA